MGKNNFGHIIVKLFLLFTVLFSVFPFYWMVTIATNSSEDMNKFPPTFIPGNLFFINLQNAFHKINFLLSMYNSFIISTIVTIFVLILCSMAGFAFAKLDFKYKALSQQKVDNEQFLKVAIDLATFIIFILIKKN